MHRSWTSFLARNPLPIIFILALAAWLFFSTFRTSPPSESRNNMVFNEMQQHFIHELNVLHVDKDIIEMAKNDLRYDDDGKLTPYMANYFLVDLIAKMKEPVTTIPPEGRRPETFVSSQRDKLELWENVLSEFTRPLSEEGKQRLKFEKEQKEADIQAVHESGCRSAPWMNSCQ